MNSISFEIPRKSDKTLIAFVQQLAEAGGILSPNQFQYALMSGGSAAVPFKSIATDPKLTSICELESDVISSFSFSSPGPQRQVSLSINRRHDRATDQLTLSPDDTADEAAFLALAKALAR